MSSRRILMSVFAGFALLSATKVFSNPIPWPPPASMPLEEMEIHITESPSGLHANFSGDFHFNYIPTDVTSMMFPVPPDATGIGVWLWDSALEWYWADDTYPTVVPELPEIPMVEWDGPFDEWGGLFTVDYEHDLIERPGEYIFFYACGTGKYFPTYDKVTIAYFDIYLPPGYEITGIWLDNIPHGWVQQGTHVSTVVTEDFGPITKDLIVSITTKYSGGTGEPNDPYRISTPEDLHSIGLHSEDWDKHFILTNDIDLSVLNVNNYNTLDTLIIESFTGVFDGNNLSITNLESTLFGRVAEPNAKVKNLTLRNPFLSGNSHPMGALVEYLEEGTIDNCHVQDANIAGCREVGALVGRNEYGIISNSSAVVDFNYFSCGRGGGGLVGGIAGYNLYGDILNCQTDITAEEGVSAAGIAYENHGNISNCTSSIDNGIGLVIYNTGMIENSSAQCTAGQDGLVTHNEGQIINCSASGDIYGKQAYHGYRSGLVGYNEGYISGCTSTCDIYIEERGVWIGGIVSYNSFGDINDCHYEGTIIVGEDSQFVGGLVGKNSSGEIRNCQSSANIICGPGSVYTGGLIGINRSLIIVDNSSFKGTIKGDFYVGGLVGSNDGVIKNSSAEGEIHGSEYIGGLIGSNGGDIIDSLAEANVNGS
ncbi:MAG: GLUG motif-containing protein, partial [Planctomycetota bacterium]